MHKTQTHGKLKAYAIRAQFVVALLLAGALPAAAQTSVTTGAAELTVGGRVQTQFNTTSVEDQQPSELLLRRAFLDATARLNDLVSGKVQIDFAGSRVSLRDVYVRLNFDPAFQVVAGNQYKPVSLLAFTGSARMLPIERGVAIRGVPASEESHLLASLGYTEHDLGVQAQGRLVNAPFGVDYVLGVFRGPLQGRVGPQDSYQYAARLGVQPAEWARIGASWTARDFADAASPDLSEPSLRKGHALVADVELGGFRPGPHLLAEVMRADVDPFSDASATGAQAWLAYRTQPLGAGVSALEPLLRVSTAKLNGARPLGIEDGTLLTPGVNIYFGGLNRLMLNYDVWRSREAENAGSFKAMLQVVF